MHRARCQFESTIPSSAADLCRQIQLVQYEMYHKGEHNSFRNEYLLRG